MKMQNWAAFVKPSTNMMKEKNKRFYSPINLPAINNNSKRALTAVYLM